MVGVIIAEFLCQTWDRTGTLPEEGSLPDTHLTDDILRILGMAKAIVECDLDQTNLADEACFWMEELLHHYAHDDFDSDNAGDSMDGWIWSLPIGESTDGPTEAANLTNEVAEGCDEPPVGVSEACALAGAVQTAFTGADREKIAQYVLSAELPEQSALTFGAGALLKAESYLGAVRTALEHGFGRDAAVCAAALAEPLYGIPDDLAELAMDSLALDLRQVIEDFIEFVLTTHADEIH